VSATTSLSVLGAGNGVDADGPRAARQVAVHSPVLGPLPPRLVALKASSVAVR
jgi:hypothetical protein